MKNKRLIEHIESLVDPVESGAMHVIQKYNEKLPVSLQHKIIESSSKQNPYMGFVVDPYAHFMFFQIIDKVAVQNQLHDNFKLVKTKVFAEDEEQYYMCICSFNVRTSAFFGSRIEAYVIAEEINTGMLSWVIVDVLSNTISYEQKNGLVGANANVVVTTGFDGNVLVNAKTDKVNLQYTSMINQGQKRKLDHRLWVEGNLSVSYGTKLATSGETFSLLFDTRELEYALEIDNVIIDANDWFESVIELEPSKIVCFPYAQHFVSDSPGSESEVTDVSSMRQTLNEINFRNLKVYTSDGFFKNQMRISLFMFVIMAIMFLIIING